jgi:hypothetical protein
MSRRNSNLPWAGWSNEKPSRKERTIMKENCGRKCFLGPQKSFPICIKGTCDVSDKGTWAAYIRAREWGSKHKRVKAKNRTKKVYKRIAKKSRIMLRKKGYDVGKSLRATRRRMRMRRGGTSTMPTNAPAPQTNAPAMQLSNSYPINRAGITAESDAFFKNPDINPPIIPDESLFGE